jgi:predicted permease
MDVLLFSFNAILPMLIPMALGWFIARRGQIGENEIGFLNRLCFRYLLSFHIFNSTLAIDFYAEFNPKMVLLCIAGILGVMLAAWTVCSLTVKNRERRCIFITSSFRSNNIIYALPLATNLFGQAGIKSAVMLVPVTIIVFNFFTVIVMVYHARAEKRRLRDTLVSTCVDIARNPLIAGSLLGIGLSLLHAPVPPSVKSGINAIAATGTPISLILLGAQIDFKKLSGSLGPALAVSMVRLVIVPAILVPLMVLAGFRGPELGALMVAFAAPCAVTNLVMARNYNIDPAFAAQTVYLSTVLSVFTLFLAITALRALALF